MSVSIDDIKFYGQLKARADNLGINLSLARNSFEINHPEAAGLINIASLSELDRFLRGYELAKATYDNNL